MATSVRDFNIELYEEHLAEISFLYEQRSAYLHDTELSWLDLADLDERLEAHVDALVVGGTLALEVCERKLGGDEPGELYAALCVCCRQGRKEAVYAALRDASLEDAEICRAFGQALAAAAPTAWREELAAVLARHARLAPVLAPMLELRRTPSEPALREALAAADDRGVAPLLSALGRVGAAESADAVEPYLQSDDPIVAEAAAVALLRLGRERIAGQLLLRVPTRPWLALPLALAGSASAVKVLEDLARSDRVSDDVLLALGLLGDLGAVRAIFDCLAVPERAPAAAVALQLLTGAELYADVFVPDEIDPDEMFDEERAQLEATGEPPMRPDGRPFGAMTVQPVVDQAVWKEWLSAHKGDFDRQRRYRYGEPYAPRALLRTLVAERAPNKVRALACEELRVRYGVDFPLAVTMPVAAQRRMLERLGSWVQANEQKFTPGAWYFHGRPVS